MRRCIMTVVSEPFVYGAVTMLASLRAHNPWYRDDIVILFNDANAPLSRSARRLIAREIPGVTFREVDDAPYGPIFAFAENVIQTPPRLRAAFYVLEAFRDADYDRIVTLDSDMLVLGDISHLFEIDAPLAVVRAHLPNQDIPAAFFNTGTMTIAPKHARAVSFARLVERLEADALEPSHGRADQAVLNLGLRREAKHYIDHRYNFSKRLVPEDVVEVGAYLAEQDVRILHYLGEKPWNLKIKDAERRYGALEDLWRAAFARHVSHRTMARFLKSLFDQDGVLRELIQPKLGPAEARKRELRIERLFTGQLHG